MQKWWNKSLTIGFFLMFVVFTSEAGNPLLKDIQLVKEVKIANKEEVSTIRPYIYKNETNRFKKYNPVNMAFGGLLFFYQNVLSQQFSANCLYTPSCSDFSKQSIKEFGLLKGTFLSADRVMRCNRIAATGIHPLRIEDKRVVDPIDFYKLRK